MSYYFKRSDESDLEEIKLPSNPDYWVRVKRRGRFADEEFASKALAASMSSVIGGMVRGQNGNVVNQSQVQAQLATAASEADMNVYNHALMCRLIIEWNLTDEAGNVVPVNDFWIGELDPADGQFLLTEIRRRMGQRSPDEQRNFPKPSGPPSMAIGSKTRKRSSR